MATGYMAHAKATMPNKQTIKINKLFFFFDSISFSKRFPGTGSRQSYRPFSTTNFNCRISCPQNTFRIYIPSGKEETGIWKDVLFG